MPAKGIHHVDLAVADVERSLTFYLGLLGPLGWVEEVRYPTYVSLLCRPGVSLRVRVGELEELSNLLGPLRRASPMMRRDAFRMTSELVNPEEMIDRLTG